MALVLEALNRIIVALGGTPVEADAASASIRRIPNRTVEVGFHVGALPQINIPTTVRTQIKADVVFSGHDILQLRTLGVPGFKYGTGGRFRDFGSGELAVLHGKERVQTEAEGNFSDARLLREIQAMREEARAAQMRQEAVTVASSAHADEHPMRLDSSRWVHLLILASP